MATSSFDGAPSFQLKLDAAWKSPARKIPIAGVPKTLKVAKGFPILASSPSLPSPDSLYLALVPFAFFASTFRNMPTLCPTAPATPERPEQLLYGFTMLGGGDSPIHTQSHTGSGALSTPRPAHARHRASRQISELLGSPVRLRGAPRRSRPLARAVQAPIPLCDYSPPPRAVTSSPSPLGGVTQDAEPSHLGRPQIALEDLIVAPLSPSPSPSGVHPLADITQSALPFVAMAGDGPADDISSTVALAVLAAVNQTIHGECIVLNSEPFLI